jgi:hypothetical protein
MLDKERHDEDDGVVDDEEEGRPMLLLLTPSSSSSDILFWKTFDGTGKNSRANSRFKISKG